MIYTEVSPRLFLIDLDQDLRGFRKFIGSWLYLGESTTILVDPGPSNSADTLLKALEDLSVSAVDLILLTHIHIDHAGGTARILDKYPMARVICHPRGVKHMINPQKLWQGSLKVLGNIAEAYGEILPLDPDVIGFKKSIETAEGSITVFETPGHAAHHLCFLFKDWLFAGEVAGVVYESDKGFYARPATPPVFKLEVSLASLDKVKKLQPASICLGHYGYIDDPSPFLKGSREQLLLWIEIIRQELAKCATDLEENIFKKLMVQDRLLGCYEMLDQDIKDRESYFIGNSINGMLQYLKSGSA